MKNLIISYYVFAIVFTLGVHYSYQKGKVDGVRQYKNNAEYENLLNKAVRFGKGAVCTEPSLCDHFKRGGRGS